MCREFLENKVNKHNEKDLNNHDEKGTLTVEEYIWIDDIFGHKCFYCDKPNPNSIDHREPRSKGGITAIWNLIISCCRCNEKKSSKDFEEFCEEKHVSEEKMELARGIYKLKEYTGGYSLIPQEEEIEC